MKTALTDMKVELAFEDVKRLFLLDVNVRQRAEPARLPDAFNQ
jgi:hypothetical protein